MNPGLAFHSVLYTFEAFSIRNKEIIKNDDAPATWIVQFISPPSDIDAVDMQKARHEASDKIPK